jgi:phosphoribosylamine--glycine ligase
MRILIVGNGGREHALLWKLSKDAPRAEFFATRPNGGMARLAQAVDVDPADASGVSDWASRNGIDLAVIGPEAPLAEGIVDLLNEVGVSAFGPTAGAARIESNKAFAKDLLERTGVPTARHRTFRSLEAAEAHIRAGGAPIVVKASGLAAGKGAIVCASVEEAMDASRSMLRDHRFGEAGQVIVIEEFMAGEELSVFALTDGRHVLTMLASQDHKRIGEGDTGPNTGGMGAYAPVSIATPDLINEVEDRILIPTLEAMTRAGCPFRGLLYAGLMITDEGPKIVEYNCRFGDPESQAVLPLLEGSLVEPLTVIASGDSIEGMGLDWRSGAAVTTVLASQGYPAGYETGYAIAIPDELESHPDVILFHAGTRQAEGLRTSGGRVMAVTGVGATLQEAAARSRGGARNVQFEGKVYRTDIGWREFARDEATRP